MKFFTLQIGNLETSAKRKRSAQTKIEMTAETQVNETESPISDDNQVVEASHTVEPEQGQDLNLFEAQTPCHNCVDGSKEPYLPLDGVNLDEASLVSDIAGQAAQLDDSPVYQDLSTNSDTALANDSQLSDPGSVDEQCSVNSSIDAVAKVDNRPKVSPESNVVHDEVPDSNNPDPSPGLSRPVIPAEILEQYDVGES